MHKLIIAKSNPRSDHFELMFVPRFSIFKSAKSCLLVLICKVIAISPATTGNITDYKLKVCSSFNFPFKSLIGFIPYYLVLFWSFVIFINGIITSVK